MTTPGLAHRLREAVLARDDTQVLYATPLEHMAPTPSETLEALERGIDAPLPPLVRELYLGAGELGLAWQEECSSRTPPAEGHVPWNLLSNACSEFWSTARSEPRRGGVISIPRAEEVFRKGYWIDRLVPEPFDEEIELDGVTLSDAALYEDLYPFDFINGYHLAGLWFDRERGDWRVVLGGDHGACWTDYQTLSVAEYLEQLERGLGGPRRWIQSSEEREVWGLTPAAADC